MSEYAHICADLDLRWGLMCLDDGGWRQNIEVTLSNDSDRDPPSLADPSASWIAPARGR